MLTVAWVGLLAGALHVVSGPDHLAALAPIAADTRRKPWLPGAIWGLGHASGVAIVGLVALLGREVIPTEWLSAVGERLVGVMLIGIGLWGLRRAAGLHVHVHRHTHDGEAHTHLHLHGEMHDEGGSHPAHSHTHAAVGIGMLHGVAGSSHFFGVLPALALPTRAASATYLGGFGLGTVLAMATFAGLIGWLGARFGRTERLYPRLLQTLSIVTIAVGGVWLAL